MENFSWGIESVKNDQMENLLYGLNIILETTEEGVSDLEERKEKQTRILGEGRT